MKINVQKSGIMHVRKKAVPRCNVSYVVNGEEIPYVSMYLGCVVDEHLTLNEMVEDKATTGRKTLGAWLHRYQQEVGDIGVGAFKKLCVPSGLINVVWCGDLGVSQKPIYITH